MSYEVGDPVVVIRVPHQGAQHFVGVEGTVYRIEKGMSGLVYYHVNFPSVSGSADTFPFVENELRLVEIVGAIASLARGLS